MTANMPPCLLTEILWERFAAEADEAATRDAWAEVEALWRAGSNMTESFEAADPRHAASLNGLGTAARSQDELAEAEALYRQALAAWERVPEWISGMEIELGARGITFHFRLQQRHREEFIALKRNRNEILAEGGPPPRSTTLASCFAPRAAGPRPSRSTGARWWPAPGPWASATKA